MVFSIVPSIFCTPMSVGLTGSPSFWARVRWMALTSLPKSRSANMSTEFFRKVMGYQMHGTRARFGYSPSLSAPFSSTSEDSIALTVSTVSSLVSVTGIEIAKTDTSFLVSGDTWWHNVPFGESCSTWFKRHLSPLSWHCWRWHLLQESCGYDPVFVGPLVAGNLLAGGFGPFLGWWKKFAKWKMTVSH